jgi:hypothetical protein
MDFLPEVQMDFIPSDDESNIGENIEDEVDDFNEDKDIYQEDIQESKIEKVVPKAKSKREDMNVNDIFNLPNDGTIQKDVKLTKKGKPRKQRPPMTEEHKEKLKIAREKAMASRQKKAAERREAKDLELQEKELLKKQKVKRVQKLKEEVDDEIPKEIKKEANFTKKDLEDAQLQAIMNYEKIRKSRKAEKEERKKKEAEEEAIRNQLRRAVAPPQQEYNPFSGCY